MEKIIDILKTVLLINYFNYFAKYEKELNEAGELLKRNYLSSIDDKIDHIDTYINMYSDANLLKLLTIDERIDALKSIKDFTIYKIKLQKQKESVLSSCTIIENNDKILREKVKNFNM